MPKNKAATSSDDSDSDGSASPPAPPPPTKKAKGDFSKPEFTGTRNNGETTWDIASNKMLKVRHFKGKMYIDIREYYDKDGNQLPTKKGISLTPEQYQKLKLLLPQVDEELNRN